MCVGIGVEDVGDRELSGGQHEIVRRARVTELVRVRLDILRLSAEIECLSGKEALEPEIGNRLSDLVGLAARKSGDPHRVAKTESLIDFRVRPGFGAFPEARAQIKRRIERLVAAAAGIEAVGSTVGRAEGRMVLFNEGCLPVHRPSLRGGRLSAGIGAGLLRPN